MGERVDTENKFPESRNIMLHYGRRATRYCNLDLWGGGEGPHALLSTPLRKINRRSGREKNRDRRIKWGYHMEEVVDAELLSRGDPERGSEIHL